VQTSCAKLFLSRFFVSKSIYVGNLPWSATEEQIRNLFSQYGTVNSVNLITDRETGRARGFGFVEMAADAAAGAIQALDGSSMDGRNLKVNEAQPKAPRQSRY
jgi:RNA recognition motif-containing protein